MRIFVTGGTGHIGSAVVRALVKAGHEVNALVRTPARAEILERLGAIPFYGDMTDSSCYHVTAAEHDALIHIAFQYHGDSAAVDKTAITTLLEAAKSTSEPRMVIYTSGSFVLGDTGNKPVAEDASTKHPAKLVAWRPAHERMVLQAANESLTTTVIRPGMVYGGRGSLTAKLFDSAANEGAAVVVGKGENFWPLVHRDDLAQLYLRLVEKKGGGIFHGVDGHPVRVKEVASAASEAAGAGGAIKTMPLKEARKKLDQLADALCLNQMIVSRRATELGWEPRRSSFIAHAKEAYEEWKASAGT